MIIFCKKENGKMVREWPVVIGSTEKRNAKME